MTTKRARLRWWQALWAVIVVAFAIPGASRAATPSDVVLASAHTTGSAAFSRAARPARCVAHAGAPCRPVVVRPRLATLPHAAPVHRVHPARVAAPPPIDHLYLRTSRLLR
jgi:hypothetical protein